MPSLELLQFDCIYATVRSSMKRPSQLVLPLVFGLCIILLPGLARATCGNGLLEPEVEQCDDGGLLPGDGCSETCTIACTAVGPAATEHTCLHGQFGPFQSVQAQVYPGSVYSDVSTPHTYFTVTLAGEPSNNRSAVLFSPTVAGVFAIYLREDYPLVLRSETGDEIPVILNHEVTSCAARDSLTRVRAFEHLEDTQRYVLDIGPWSGSSVSFALEYLPNFRRWLYPDTDGDGFGAGTDDEVIGLSWCVPPAGYSPAANDCDDDDASVSPSATEQCNGRDDDCNGTADDGGAALCEGHSDGPSCISSAAMAHCGCNDSNECGPERHCEANTQRCEEGTGGGAGGEQGSNTGAAGGSGQSATAGGAGGQGGNEPERDVAAAGHSGEATTGGGGVPQAGGAGDTSVGPNLPGEGGAGAETEGTAGSRPTGSAGEAGETARTPAERDGTDQSTGCACRLGSPARSDATLLAVLVGGALAAFKRRRAVSRRRGRGASGRGQPV